MTTSSSRQRKAEKAEVAPGDMLVGKFRVERVVGRGGMGVVVEATNVQLDQKVALKLLAAGTEDPAVVERFSNEARAAARLRSEHVARVFDVGKDTIHGPFIVMEMLDGKTLADVLRTTGRVPLHRAIEYVIGACEGLAEAHARNIVHQDVKPGNLFLVTGNDGRPTVKLLDFGIATVRTKERESNTKSSHPSAGTPAYLSPEQLRGTEAVDHRADVWALGCVLYELLVGERAFRAARFTELVTKILETPPDPIPSELEVPPPVAAAIERCLDKDPAKRFTSAGALALTLLPFARRRAHSAVARAVAHVKTGGIDPHLEMPSSMPPPPSDSGIDILAGGNLRLPSAPAFPDGNAKNVPTAAPPGPPNRKPLIGAAVALLLVGGVVAWLVAGRGGSTESSGKNVGTSETASTSAGSGTGTGTPVGTTPSGTGAPLGSATLPSETEPAPKATASSAKPLLSVMPILPRAPLPKGPLPPKPSAAPSANKDSEIRRER